MGLYHYRNAFMHDLPSLWDTRALMNPGQYVWLQQKPNNLWGFHLQIIRWLS